MLDETLIAGAVATIIATRDFCGNESEAVRDYAADHGIADQWRDLYRAAMPKAEVVWNAARKAAGVF